MTKYFEITYKTSKIKRNISSLSMVDDKDAKRNTLYKHDFAKPYENKNVKIELKALPIIETYKRKNKTK